MKSVRSLESLARRLQAHFGKHHQAVQQAWHAVLLAQLEQQSQENQNALLH
jgi:hypothetical protein